MQILQKNIIIVCNYRLHQVLYGWFDPRQWMIDVDLRNRILMLFDMKKNVSDNIDKIQIRGIIMSPILLLFYFIFVYLFVCLYVYLFCYFIFVFYCSLLQYVYFQCLITGNLCLSVCLCVSVCLSVCIVMFNLSYNFAS